MMRIERLVTQVGGSVSVSYRPLASGLLLLSSLWAGPALASPPTQPVTLPDLPAKLSLGTVSGMNAPPVIADPTLFLPPASEQISHIVLKLSERQLYAYRGDREVASYPVAVGRANWETPTGTFTVFQRLQSPTWEHPLTGAIVPPGPDNPLGDRWLGFWSDGTNAIGFHGTPHEHLIGEAVSHGCVRMRNADIVELYDRVRLGTPVIVQP